MIDIIKGHVNELFDWEGDLSKERLAICVTCPLYKLTELGYRCDPHLYLNPETMEVSETPQEGFYGGCNCRLAAKTRVPEASCPAGLW